MPDIPGNIEKQLLNEACLIAEHLIEQLHYDEKGFCWNTLHYDDSTGIVSGKLSINILNGAPGIILFMLELYRHTGTDRYLDLAKGAIQRLLNDPVSEAPEYFTLYTGATGLIYTAVKIYEISGDHAFLESAKVLAKEYEAGIKLRVKKKDLLSGDAGNLLALTYLYHFSREESVFSLIVFLIERIVNNARPAAKGIKWMENSLSIDSLTGFSHGSSGVAYVLMQVGHYFGSPDLIWLAEQAFDYEMSYFSKDKNNWIDLRLLTSWLDRTDIFDWNIDKFKAITNNINAWAHGAAGIGLARLHAFHITGKKNYLKHTRIVERRSLEDFRKKQWINYSLLNGFGGIAEFLLTAFNNSGKKSLLHTAQAIALEAIQYNRSGHLKSGALANDPGLFTGLSGIGYLLLRTINAGQYDSILQPQLRSRGITAIETKYRLQYFALYYGVTLKLLTRLQPGVSFHFDKESLGDFQKELNQSIKSVPDASAKQLLTDIFKLETFLVGRWRIHKGRQCFITRIGILQQRNKCLQDEPTVAFMGRKFVHTPFVAVHRSYYSWSNRNGNTEHLPVRNSTNGYWNLAFSGETSVELHQLNAFTAFILLQLKTPSSVPDIVESMNIAGIDKEDLTNRVVLQLREMLTRFLIMEM
jgi:hypothetical protein